MALVAHMMSCDTGWMVEKSCKSPKHYTNTSYETRWYQEVPCTLVLLFERKLSKCGEWYVIMSGVGWGDIVIVYAIRSILD